MIGLPGGAALLCVIGWALLGLRQKASLLKVEMSWSRAFWSSVCCNVCVCVSRTHWAMLTSRWSCDPDGLRQTSQCSSVSYLT